MADSNGEVEGPLGEIDAYVRQRHVHDEPVELLHHPHDLGQEQ